MTRLVDNATFRLPGALPGALLPELFAVLDEFFQVTSCWYEDISFTALPTQNTYTQAPEDFTYLLTSAQGKVIRLRYVKDSGGVGVEASMPIPGDVVLRHAPVSTSGYIARSTLTVSDPTTRDGYPECPDWVIAKYSNGLLDGILGRMMSQIAKPYSSGQVAMMHLKRFRSAMSSARVETTRQNLHGAQTWMYPQTFNRRR